MQFSAGAYWDGSAHSIKLLHELCVTAFKPFCALLGFHRAL